MESAIKLHCRCGKTTDYDRATDNSIPASVVRIESTNCDECENGDFGSEQWFDAEGNEVLPVDEVEDPVGACTTGNSLIDAALNIDIRELEEARADLFIGRRQEGLIHLERVLGGDFVGRIAQN